MVSEALRKAAEQAISALSNVAPTTSDQVFDFNHARLSAIVALRAALAEPEQSEPFGYVSEHNCTGPYEYQFHKDQSTIYPDNCRAIHKVYTTPPRREPLSDEQMRHCAQAMDAEPLAEGWSELIKFARAIEQAHGIGEKT